MLSTERRPLPRLLSLFLNLIVLAIPFAAPALVINLTIRLATLNASLGEAANYQSHYLAGCIHNGKLFYNLHAWRADHKPNTDSNRLMVLDLKTGEEQDVPLPYRSKFLTPLQVGAQIVLHTDAGLSQLLGSSPDPIGPMREFQRDDIPAPLFEYEGQITTISKNSDKAICLRHLVNGQWIDGRRIRLPSQNQRWIDDSQAGGRRMSAKTSPPIPGVVRKEGTYGVVVSQYGDRLVLLMTVNEGLVGYRIGIEFDDDDAIPSALAPDNFDHEVTGWRSLPMVGTQFNQIQVAFDAQGLIVTLRDRGNPGSKVFREDATGKWNELDGLQNGLFHRQMIIDHSDGLAYLVELDWFEPWNITAFRRIEKDSVGPVFLKTPGTMDPYLRSRRNLWAGFVLAWICHFAAVAMVARYFQVGMQREEIEYETLTAKPAAAWRCLSALTVDLAIVAMSALVVHSSLTRLTGIQLTESGRDRLGRALLSVERLAVDSFDISGDTRYGDINWRRLQTESAEMLRPFTGNPLLYGCCAISLVIPLLAKTVFEGLSGMTPGKWFFGIRTVALTLNRPGIFRCLIRDAFGVFDYAGLATPLPATGLMAMTAKVQRLGDYIADTAVIAAASIHEVDFAVTPENDVATVVDSRSMV